MSKQEYKNFQDFQTKLWFFIDAELKADEVFGNEVFQRMSDASFDIFQKYKKSIKNEDQ